MGLETEAHDGVDHGAEGPMIDICHHGAMVQLRSADSPPASGETHSHHGHRRSGLDPPVRLSPSSWPAGLCPVQVSLHQVLDSKGGRVVLELRGHGDWIGVRGTRPSSPLGAPRRRTASGGPPRPPPLAEEPLAQPPLFLYQAEAASCIP